MIRLFIALIAAAFVTAGCAPPRDIARERMEPLAQAGQPAPAATPRDPKSKSAPLVPRPVLPKVELTEQLMFKLLLAEVAEQRGQLQVAVPAYLELARETRDPRIAQRATEVAWNARFADAAVEAAGIWLQAEPNSSRARQVLATLLVSQQQLDQARGHFEQWLASDRANVGQSFLQLSTLLARHKDKKQVLDLMRTLARPYQDVPEARLAVAQAAWNANDEALAISESAAALKARPDWDLAALFQAQALQRRSNDDALKFLADYLKTQPKSNDARLNYARLLVAAKRYPDARREFEILVAQNPQNADITMAVAMLAMQAADYESAETHLKRALDIGYSDPDMARIYLGQVNEERKRFDDALKWYTSVQPGEQYVNAQSRYAGVLAKQGKLTEARKYLQQVQIQNEQQRLQLTQAEAALLREASKYQDAFDLLGQALQKTPDSPDLLYDHAMAAEKVNRVDVLEANLRKLIGMRPDHAHAYNALGYTLADRNERLPEAHQLIEKALQLAPDDAFIMDSMGWVLYRMGRNREALDYLQRAYAVRADADIAAHLGEVLWAAGQHDQARKIWSDALKEHAQNEALQNTVKRFAPVILPAAR